MGTSTVPISIPAGSTIDQAVLVQIAQLSTQLAVAIATKNIAGAVVIAMQLAGLIAGLFAPSATAPMPTSKPA